MWKEIPLDRIPSTSNTLSISKNGISFSAKFIKNYKLEERDWIKFFIQTNNIYQIGFTFFKDKPHGDALKLLTRDQSAGKSTKANTLISKNKVLKETQINITNSDKLSEDFEITHIKKDDIFYIDLIPCFEFKTTREGIEKLNDSDRGIYRYRDSEDRVIYIGKGYIKNRLKKEPERREWDINKIEYSIIEDEDTQFKWENHYIVKHFEEHGATPTWNDNKGHGKKN
jgi:hypothetical protein